MSWREMSQRVILDHQPYIKVVKKDFQKPDGQEVKDYYLLEYPTWVNVIALTPDNKIILVNQFRPGAEKTLRGIPAGSLIEGQDPSPEAAIKRELTEETGYGNGKFIHIGTRYPNPANHTNVVFSYLAIGVEPTFTATDHEEGTTVETVPFIDYVKNVYDNPTSEHEQSIFTAALSLAIMFILKTQDPQLEYLRQELKAYLLG